MFCATFAIIVEKVFSKKQRPFQNEHDNPFLSEATWKGIHFPVFPG